VTTDIGANDILGCVDDMSGAMDRACVNRASRAIPKNLAAITRALRQAGTHGSEYADATYRTGSWRGTHPEPVRPRGDRGHLRGSPAEALGNVTGTGA
jgi:hypothetical protein